MCLIWFFCQWYEKLNCKGISLLRNQKDHYRYLLILLSPYNLCLLLCPSLHKMSLSISNFLEEISSLSYYIVFLYFYAWITEEVFLISPCYSLNAEFQRIARRDKKDFLSDQCIEIEENNIIRKTRDLFKKIAILRDISCKDGHNKRHKLYGLNRIRRYQ